MLQIALSGTLFIYQGQELGMKNVPVDWPIEDYLDVATINFYNHCKVLTEAGKKAPGTPQQVKEWAQKKARDNARTPVQWSDEPQAGFTTGTPWMRVQEDDARSGWNAEAQANDPHSVLSFYKKVLALRKEEKTLIYGNYNQLFPNDPQLFAFVRNLQGAKSIIVLLNFSDSDKDVKIAADEVSKAQSQLGQYTSALPLADLTNWKTKSHFILGNYQEEIQWVDGGDTLRLRPYEGIYLSLA
jgi:oligo-1,6-glucosidase